MSAMTATPPGLGTVLIVDDDATLRGALDTVLTPAGYRVVTAATAETGYERLASEPADAVLIDVHLPTMSGLALSVAMLARWPELEGRIAFMTADPEAPDVRPWLRHNRCTVFSKPFGLHQIPQWLHRVLRARRRSVLGG